MIQVSLYFFSKSVQRLYIYISIQYIILLCYTERTEPNLYSVRSIYLLAKTSS